MARDQGCNRIRWISFRSVGCGVRAVLRPAVLRVAAAHVAPRVRPGAFPEPRQIGGDGDRPPGRGQQRQPQRNPPAGQQRRRRHAIERLRPGRGQRRRLRIVDRARGRPAAPDASAGRGPAARARSQGSGPRRIACRSSRCRSASRVMPARCGGSQSCTVAFSAASLQVRPAGVGLDAAHQRDPGLNWRAASVQGSGRSPAAPTAAARAPAICAGSAVSVRSDSTSVPEPPAAARQDRAGDRVEPGLHLLGHPRGERRRQRVRVQRCREADARRRLQFQRRRPPAARPWPAGRWAAAGRRRRRTGGTIPARRGAARCGRERRRRAAAPGSPSAGVSRGTPQAAAILRRRPGGCAPGRRGRRRGRRRAIAARRSAMSAGASAARSGSRSSSSAARSAASAACPRGLGRQHHGGQTRMRADARHVAGPAR